MLLLLMATDVPEAALWLAFYRSLLPDIHLFFGGILDTINRSVLLGVLIFLSQTPALLRSNAFISKAYAYANPVQRKAAYNGTGSIYSQKVDALQLIHPFVTKV
jgi:hypothetical protein